MNWISLPSFSKASCSSRSQPAFTIAARITSQARRSLLQRLQRAADRALADATSSACAVLAGWRPA